MSRYLFEVNGDDRVYIGWDNPLQTFFFQKFINYDKPEEEIVIEKGLDYKEIPTLNQLVEFMWYNKYDLGDYWYNVLFDDLADRTEPTPLQKRMNEFFTKQVKK